MPKLTIGGDAKGAIKALTDIKKAQKEVADGGNKAEKSLTKMEKAARRIQEANAPQKRYNRQIKETALLANKNKISIDDAKRAAMRYGRTLDRAGQSGKQAFGGGAAASIARVAAGYLSAAAAVSAVTRALQKNAEERERAVEGSKSAVKGEASLAQLAVTQGNTLEERKAAQRRLLAESRGVFGSGAFATRDEAGSATFDLNSSGLNREDRQFAFKLKRSGALDNIGGAAKAHSALTKSLGSDEVGSFDDFIDKALQASSLAPALANEIPLAATRAGGSARALGLSDEFLFAGTALLAGKSGSAEIGGTEIASFLKQIEKALPEHPELKGLSGVDLVKAVGALPEEQQGFGGILGDRSEAIRGFRGLRDNLGVLEEQVGKIDRAQHEDLAKQAIIVATSDPNTQAAILQRKKKNQLELSLLDTATNDLLFNAALDERKVVRRNRAASGDALDQAAVEARLALESVQVFVATAGGLNDANDRKKSIQREILSEGDIKDPDLVAALKENTQSNNRLADKQRPITTRAE